jgi:hypothetical protein
VEIKKHLNEPSEVKEWLQEVAIRLVVEHPDEAPLNLHERSPPWDGLQMALAVVGALIEYVELLEARVKELEKPGEINWEQLTPYKR